MDESGVITGSVSGGNAWSLSGNAGTNPGANFLGTTDSVSLTLAVNDAAALRLVPNDLSPNIVGGYSGNSVTSDVAGSVIGGGGSSFGPNRIEGDHGTIGGGVGNAVTADYGTVGGGDSISVTGSAATVGGGGYNTASGYGAVVSGGGGFDLDVGLVGNRAAGNWSAIGGGSWNEATATHATVSGGFANVAGGLKATIGGGESIRVTGEAATVAGGSLITATGDYAAVGGGIGHVVRDSMGTVGGGAYNVASGLAATVPGGSAAEAGLYGQMAHASGAFSAIGDAQESFYVLRGETTPGSPTSELFLDGSSERLILDNRTVTFDILVVARTAFPWSAGYAAQGVIEGWGAGAVGLLGSPIITQLGDQIGGTGFAISAEHGSLVLIATGPADTTVRWVATVRTAEVAW